MRGIVVTLWVAAWVGRAYEARAFPLERVEGNAPIVVRVATPFGAGHILTDAAFKFKEILERNRGYHAEVAISVLDEQQSHLAMRSCDPRQRVADVLLTSGQPISDYAQAYAFVSAPFVLRSFEHFRRVWNSHLGDELVTLLEGNGNLVALEPIYTGAHQVTAQKPIYGPTDFSRVLLGLSALPDWVALWLPQGVEVVPVPASGLYEALKTAAANASEGDLAQIISLRLFEVQSHLNLTNHQFGIGLPLANRCFFRGELSASGRARIRSAMRAAARWATGRVVASEAAAVDRLRGNHMIVVNSEPNALRAASRHAIEQLFVVKWYVTTWTEVLNLE